jgi:hypothetical protein
MSGEKKRGNALRVAFLGSDLAARRTLSSRERRKEIAPGPNRSQRSGQCLFTTVPERRDKNPRLYFSPQPLSRPVRYDTNAAGRPERVSIHRSFADELYSNAP